MDLTIPDFGDVVGLRRLYRAAVERIRREDILEADRQVWIAELTRQYRVATADGFGSVPAVRGWEPDDGPR